MSNLLFSKALMLANLAHYTQVDKGYQPYILHPISVMLKMKTMDEKIVALLHDVVEDSTWTIENLRKEGLPEHILEAIDAITKRKGESVEEYFDRVMSNSFATKVKFRDIEHNLDAKRLLTLSEKDLSNIQHYHKYWKILKTTKEIIEDED